MHEATLKRVGFERLRKNAEKWNHEYVVGSGDWPGDGPSAGVREGYEVGRMEMKA